MFPDPTVFFLVPVSCRGQKSSYLRRCLLMDHDDWLFVGFKQVSISANALVLAAPSRDRTVHRKAVSRLWKKGNHWWRQLCRAVSWWKICHSERGEGEFSLTVGWLVGWKVVMDWWDSTEILRLKLKFSRIGNLEWIGLAWGWRWKKELLCWPIFWWLNPCYINLMLGLPWKEFECRRSSFACFRYVLSISDSKFMQFLWRVIQLPSSSSQRLFSFLKKKETFRFRFWGLKVWKMNIAIWSDRSFMVHKVAVLSETIFAWCLNHFHHHNIIISTIAIIPVHLDPHGYRRHPVTIIRRTNFFLPASFYINP